MGTAECEFFTVTETRGERAGEEGKGAGSVGADGIEDGEQTGEGQQRSATGGRVDYTGGDRGRGKEKPTPERITHATSKGNRAEALQQFC